MEKIKKIFRKIEGWFDDILTGSVSGLTWSLSFLGMIFLRVFLEKYVASSQVTAESAIAGLLYNFFFFAILYLLIWLFLSLILKLEIRKLSKIMLWSLWLLILPPIIDMWKTGGSVFWSFYSLNGLAGLWLQFVTFFGHLPSGIVYFGTKITFILAIILIGGVVLVRTKNILKALVGALGTYVILFVLGTLPSWLGILYYSLFRSKKSSEVNEIDIVQFFGHPYQLFGIKNGDIRYAFTNNLNIIYFWILFLLVSIMFFAIDRRKMWAIIKNARFPQLIYHSGLFFVGLGLGLLAYPQNYQINIFSLLSVAMLLAGVCLAWLASVVMNDIYDFRIDKISNPERPLQRDIFDLREYAELGFIFFMLSLLAGIIIGIGFAAILLAYQIMAWAYSAKPYRLKRFPAVATLVSAGASVLIIFLGFNLFSGGENFLLVPWRVITLLLITLTLSLPIKDFKDIEGDKKDDVWTIPVLFGDELGRIIVASGIFISFILSVFFLNEFKLFWWALIFGGAAYLAVTSKKIKPRQLFWWVLGIVSVYGLILVKIVFLK